MHLLLIKESYLCSCLHSRNRCSDSNGCQLHNLDLYLILRTEEDELYIRKIEGRQSLVHIIYMHMFT